MRTLRGTGVVSILLTVMCACDTTTTELTPDALLPVDAPDCVPVAEVCDNAADDDCDDRIDCDDADCEGNSSCGCGTLEVTGGSLPLPDGACPKDESLSCEGVENEFMFTGFSAGQTLGDITKLLGICLNMEHSWMRDLVRLRPVPERHASDALGLPGPLGR